MSEGNVPPRSHDADSLQDTQGQLPLEPTHPPAADDDWETVPLVGMPDLSTPPAEPSLSSPVTIAQAKEAELQSRIVDLNQCNEVLLARVHQLEDALERSHHALQEAAERSQRRTEENKVAAAQSQSVAQLLSELDDANAALKRQTLLAETLTTQLKTAEERAERLEKECAILRKRKAERAKQLQAAEETCTDLRSRLQRQQQYTLQFKAALEKCLDTSAFQHTSQSIETAAEPDVATASGPVTPAQPIGMPRSESIRPWSANPADIHTDHQLQSLLRSQPPAPASATPVDAARTGRLAEPAAPPPATTPPTPPPAADPVADTTADSNHDAEQQLWHDVERVMKNAVQSDAPVATAAESEAESTAETTASPAAPAPTAAPADTAEFTEPIPWGAPIKSQEPTSVAPAAPAATPAEPDPLPTAAQRESVSPPSTPTAPPPSPPLAYAGSISALEAMQTAHKSPSPLVHPLRPPQRKRKSLSAVELPSFPPLPKVQNE